MPTRRPAASGRVVVRLAVGGPRRQALAAFELLQGLERAGRTLAAMPLQRRGRLGFLPGGRRLGAATRYAFGHGAPLMHIECARLVWLYCQRAGVARVGQCLIERHGVHDACGPRTGSPGTVPFTRDEEPARRLGAGPARGRASWPV